MNPCDRPKEEINEEMSRFMKRSGCAGFPYHLCILRNSLAAERVRISAPGLFGFLMSQLRVALHLTSADDGPHNSIDGLSRSYTAHGGTYYHNRYQPKTLSQPIVVALLVPKHRKCSRILAQDRAIFSIFLPGVT